MSAITKPINLLVVEDSENDAQLLIQELRRGGYAPTHRRVETAEDLIKALRQPDWDLVVSDYSMPSFNGSDALKLFTEQKQNIPFIFVSGTQGEDAAVRMMKAGASDYIVKGNLSRFVPAVEREIESARLRRQKLQHELTTQHLAAIVNSSQDAIYSLNSYGTIVSWNPAAEEIYGYSAQEIMGRSIALLFPLTHRNELLETMAYIGRGELASAYETQRRCKDGRNITVYLTTSPIKNTAGKTVGTSVIARDISKQKQEEHDRLNLIAELTQALNQAEALAGQLPICGGCKRIRDEDNTWLQVETYIAQKSPARFTRDVCPECLSEYEAVADAKAPICLAQ
jgi:PAS domain S-box-containing protein